MVAIVAIDVIVLVAYLSINYILFNLEVALPLRHCN